jgi:hypothetical protein
VYELLYKAYKILLENVNKEGMEPITIAGPQGISAIAAAHCRGYRRARLRAHSEHESSIARRIVTRCARLSSSVRALYPKIK